MRKASVQLWVNDEFSSHTLVGFLGVGGQRSREERRAACQKISEEPSGFVSLWYRLEPVWFLLASAV